MVTTPHVGMPSSLATVAAIFSGVTGTAVEPGGVATAVLDVTASVVVLLAAETTEVTEKKKIAKGTYLEVVPAPWLLRS